MMASATTTAAEAGQVQATPLPLPLVLLMLDVMQARGRTEAATRLAFEEASLRGADLVAMHAWSDSTVFPAIEIDWHLYRDEAEENLAERLAGWQEQYPDVHIQRRLPCDRPAHWLVAESEHAQLVVVGNRGRGGFAGLLLGSVSSAVARKSQAPVIVVRN